MKKVKQGLDLHRVEQVDLALIDEPDPCLRLSVQPDGLDELASSMSRLGLINPVLLAKEGGRYRIIAGDRRVRAARMLKWKHIPARVLLKENHERTALSVHENIFREDLSPVEEANAIRLLKDQEGMDIDQIAHALSKSRAWVDSRIEILKWPGYLQEAVHNREISYSAARELSLIKDDELRERLTNVAKVSGVSVKTAMQWRLEELATKTVMERSDVAGALGATSGVYQEYMVRCPHCEEEVPISQTEAIRICKRCLSPQTGPGS